MGENKIEKSVKRQKSIKAENIKGNAMEFAKNKLSKREIKALAYAKFIKDIASAAKMPKFNVKERAGKIIQRTIEDFKGFRVNPDGSVEAYAMDAAECEYAATAFKPELTYEIISKYRQIFIGYQNCAVIRQNAIVDNACTMPAIDAMASGYQIMYPNGSKKAKVGELEEFVERSQDEYGIKDVCVKFRVNEAQFGWGLAIPTFNKEMPMDGEFNIDLVEKGSYTGLTVIDPYWITYDFDQRSLTDPTSKYYYQPTWYSFPTGSGGYKRIHRSWVYKRIWSNVADFLKPTYFFGGVSLVQQIYEAVYAYEKALNEAMLLLLTKRSYVADAEMSNYMANPQEVNALLDATAELHSNYGIWVKQIGSEVSQMDTSLNGLEEVINACMQRICAIAKIPAEKLFKLAIKGLNSSGSFELGDYKQYLKSIQSNDYLGLIKYHNMLMTKSETGKVKPIIVEFNPIDTPDELTKAKIREIDARTSVMRTSAKITDRKEERIKLIASPNSGFNALDPEPPEINPEEEHLFSVEKDNMGRPMPKATNNTIRGKTKADLIEEAAREEEDTNE